MHKRYIRVAVIGAQGYSGLVLAKLLIEHPCVEFVAVFSRNPCWKLCDDLPHEFASKVPTYSMEKLFDILPRLDAIFLATPVEVSLALVPKLLQFHLKIIDLSGAFRLKPLSYAKAYGHKHTASSVIAQASYGLCPWQRIYKQLVSNPGCYATGALMALIPLLRAGVIDPGSVIVDAKSGVTGSGRSPKTPLLFAELAEDFYPYKIEGHQHLPEIETYLRGFSSVLCSPTLITHLLPIRSGIQMTIYTNLLLSEEAVIRAFHCAYGDYPFLTFSLLKTLSSGQKKKKLSLRGVVGTAQIHVVMEVKGEKLLLFVTFDNLLKGAASQAIENFNQIFQLPLTSGLVKEKVVL